MNKRNHNPHSNGPRGGSLPDNHGSGEAKRHKVIRLIESGRYESALATFRDGERDPQLRNARAVCLMRLGRLEDAVRIYRDLVLKPGCTWMIPGLPVVYKTNFATALLLAGRPSGCLQVLAEIGDPNLPTVIQLRAALKEWEAQLPWWTWLNWRYARIDPPNRPVAIDFVPGEFEAPLTVAEGRQPEAPGAPGAVAC